MFGKPRVLILAFLVVISAYVLYCLFIPVGGESVTVPLTIEKGQRVTDIAKELKEQNLIRSAMVFKVYIQLSGSRNKLQAGDFELHGGMTTPEIAEILKSGTFDKRVTILEGWRVEEIAEYLNNAGFNFTTTDFIQAAKPSEGRLFPDTYVVPRYANIQNIIDVFTSNFNEQVGPQILADIEKSEFDLNQVLILASIVERETLSSEDRPIVAGILIKRYQSDWPLQSDVTTQYALGFVSETNPDTSETASTWWKKELTAEDVMVDSPYNTRFDTGLPPTPICNPGIDSIRAVVYSQETSYWYYLSDKEGKMHYADTLEEHNKFIDTYLK